MRGYPRQVNCKKCGVEFTATCARSKWCGDREKKTGCAYEERKRWKREKEKKRRANNEDLQDYMRNYGREWKRQQRALNTDYIKRQKLSYREYYKKNKERLKQKNKEWRRNNLDKILERNRARRIRERGVEGSHTNLEWENLKQKHSNKCAKCGISEWDLFKIWDGGRFSKLTRDHVVPISKGGTDYISNIRPLCISCNASKKDKNQVNVITHGTFDTPHNGHVRLLKRAKALGDHLTVALSTDEFNKLKGKESILNYEQRKEVLEAIVYVDKVIPEETWEQKKWQVPQYDVFVMGDDWKGKFDEYGCIYLPRTKGISTTWVKHIINTQNKKKMS